MGDRASARLVGVRTPYADMPPRVRDWVERELSGPVCAVTPRIGGMSPAVAASVEASNGRRAFVKAVGAGVNPDTPGHFRSEVQILERLSSAPYRAKLHASYDDGDWVALMLEDIDGRHPDWSRPTDRAAVLEAVERQARELTPAPDGLPTGTVGEGIRRCVRAVADLSTIEIAALPGWAQESFDELCDLARQAADRVSDETFCHWDIRHDNLLIRHRDGQPLLLDWGMARHGPWWGERGLG